MKISESNIFQLYICLHFSRIGYDHGSVVRWSLLCWHWHRSGTEISQRRWQSCFFESTKLHSCYQCKICSASTWRDWQKGMYIWMTAGFWTSLEDQFFRESLHNAYGTVIEKYFNSSHSNVPIKFHHVQSYVAKGWNQGGGWIFKKFSNARGGPRVGMIFNPRGGRG